jgi:hypothetical protein
MARRAERTRRRPRPPESRKAPPVRGTASAAAEEDGRTRARCRRLCLRGRSCGCGAPMARNAAACARSSLCRRPALATGDDHRSHAMLRRAVGLMLALEIVREIGPERGLAAPARQSRDRGRLRGELEGEPVPAQTGGGRWSVDGAGARFGPYAIARHGSEMDQRIQWPAWAQPARENSPGTSTSLWAGGRSARPSWPRLGRRPSKAPGGRPFGRLGAAGLGALRSPPFNATRGRAESVAHQGRLRPSSAA